MRAGSVKPGHPISSAFLPKDEKFRGRVWPAQWFVSHKTGLRQRAL
jgi:hypothetical protein